MEQGSEILQDLKSSKYCSQPELFQPGHGLRPDLHTALEPGSEILQDPKLSKSCCKSQTTQLGQELQPDLHNVKSLESSILQLHESFLETPCQ